MVLAEAGEHPAVYRFPGMKKPPEAAGELFRNDFSWTIYPGRKQEFRGMLRNPFSASRRFNLKLELPEGNGDGFRNSGRQCSPGDPLPAVFEE